MSIFEYMRSYSGQATMTVAEGSPGSLFKRTSLEPVLAYYESPRPKVTDSSIPPTTISSIR